MDTIDSQTLKVISAVIPQILEGMSFGLLVTDQQGKLLYHNPVADRYLGITAATHLRDIHALPLLKESVRAAISAGHEDAVSRPAGGCISWDSVVSVEGEKRILAIRNRVIPQLGTQFRVFFMEDVTLLRRAELHAQGEATAGIETRDPQMLRAIRLAEQVANSDASILIHGESGTGKGMLARLIHDESPRCRKPLVEVNCAAIPENLWEAEFFGAVKGAYTGSISDRIGRFAAANGGTLFLDEISELSKAHQAKLLKVLEEHAFEPVGSMKTQKVNVRVVAATNRGLKEAVESGDFRADLYYRLNVIPIQVPPLRERRQDILHLSEYFLTKFGGSHVRKLSQEVKHALLDYEWPGNVRELRNVMEYASICASKEELTIADLPQEFVEQANYQASKRRTLAANHQQEDQERKELQALLRKYADNRSAVARELGIDRVTLWRKMNRLGLNHAGEN